MSVLLIRVPLSLTTDFEHPLSASACCQGNLTRTGCVCVVWNRFGEPVQMTWPHPMAWYS